MRRMTWIAACWIAPTLVAGPSFGDTPIVIDPSQLQPMPTAQPTAPATPFTLPDASQVVAAFGKFVADQPTFTAEQKQLVARRLTGPREGAIVDSLQSLYPDFAKAMDLLANEKNEQAIALLDALGKSDDPYLAANAWFFQARALVNDEHYEAALPLLEPLVGAQRDKTLYAGQAMFLRATCQAGLLQRKEAIESFRGFIKADADAPERLIVGALHRMDELEQMSDGSLGDVEEHMDYSRRKLSQEDAGKPTQEQQQKAVAMLDELIKKAEDKEKGGGGGGGGGGGSGGNQQNQGPAGGAGGGPGGAAQSTAPAGQAQIGALRRTTGGDENDQWGEARQRQRDQVLNAIKARYPERYRELVEQYYRALQDDKP